VKRYLFALLCSTYLFSFGFIFSKHRGLIGILCSHFRRAQAPQEEMPVPLLPTTAAGTLFPDSTPIVVREPEAADGNVSPLELIVLCRLVSSLRPSRLFEIGTFDGRTTLNLAANSPAEAVVYTLDLPRSALDTTCLPLAADDRKYIDKAVSGSKFAHTDCERKIIQLWGDSAKFDFSPYEGNMDFVFVDASHSYEYVLQDSRTALTLLRPAGGLILWHDYGTPFWSGPTKALNELILAGGAFAGLRWISGSSLAYLAVGARA